MSVRAPLVALAVLGGALVASMIAAGDIGRLRDQRTDRDLVLQATTDGWAEAARGLHSGDAGTAMLTADLNRPQHRIALLLLDADGTVIARSSGAGSVDAQLVERPGDPTGTLIASLPDGRRTAARTIGANGMWTIVAVADDADFVTSEDRPAVLALKWLAIGASIAGLVHLATRPVARHLQALHVRATRDAITGLDNRATITTTLDRALGGSEPVTVAIVDLDEFKPVNDTWGHRVGDEALGRVGQRLAQFADDHDMSAGRLGGDEFLIVATGARALPAETVWDHLVDTMVVPFVVRDREIRIGASIGVVHVQKGDDRSVENVLSLADRALYGVKRRGGNGWQTSSDVIDARSSAQPVGV